MVGGSGLSKKRRRRGALRGCCDVWRWLGPPLHDPAGASNRKPLYLMVNLQMENPYIQWKFRMPPFMETSKYTIIELDDGTI
jgi:hypothetical protein